MDRVALGRAAPQLIVSTPTTMSLPHRHDDDDEDDDPDASVSLLDSSVSSGSSASVSVASTPSPRARHAFASSVAHDDDDDDYTAAAAHRGTMRQDEQHAGEPAQRPHDAQTSEADESAATAKSLDMTSRVVVPHLGFVADLPAQPIATAASAPPHQLHTNQPLPHPAWMQFSGYTHGAFPPATITPSHMHAAPTAFAPSHAHAVEPALFYSTLAASPTSHTMAAFPAHASTHHLPQFASYPAFPASSSPFASPSLLDPRQQSSWEAFYRQQAHTHTPALHTPTFATSTHNDTYATGRFTSFVDPATANSSAFGPHQPAAASVPSSGALRPVGLYYPIRASFQLEEAELDAQIAAAQLSLMDDEDMLLRLQQRARTRREQEEAKEKAKRGKSTLTYAARVGARAGDSNAMPASARSRRTSPAPSSLTPRTRGPSPAPVPLSARSYSRDVSPAPRTSSDRTRSRGASPAPISASVVASRRPSVTAMTQRRRSASVDLSPARVHTTSGPHLQATTTALPFPTPQPIRVHPAAAATQVSASLLAPTASSARKARHASMSHIPAITPVPVAAPSLTASSEATPRGRSRAFRELAPSPHAAPSASRHAFGTSSTTGRAADGQRTRATSASRNGANTVPASRVHERTTPPTAAIAVGALADMTELDRTLVTPSAVAPPAALAHALSSLSLRDGAGPSSSQIHPDSTDAGSPKKRARLSTAGPAPLNERVFVRPARTKQRNHSGDGGGVVDADAGDNARQNDSSTKGGASAMPAVTVAPAIATSAPSTAVPSSSSTPGGSNPTARRPIIPQVSNNPLPLSSALPISTPISASSAPASLPAPVPAAAVASTPGTQTVAANAAPSATAASKAAAIVEQDLARKMKEMRALTIQGGVASSLADEPREYPQPPPPAVVIPFAHKSAAAAAPQPSARQQRVAKASRDLLPAPSSRDRSAMSKKRAAAERIARDMIEYQQRLRDEKRAAALAAEAAAAAASDSFASGQSSMTIGVSPNFVDAEARPKSQRTARENGTPAPAAVNGVELAPNHPSQPPCNALTPGDHEKLLMAPTKEQPAATKAPPLQNGSSQKGSKDEDNDATLDESQIDRTLVRPPPIASTPALAISTTPSITVVAGHPPSSAAVDATPTPAAAPPADSLLAATNEMLRNVFRFYSHPVSESAAPARDRYEDASLDPAVASHQMSRTDFFHFLVECDLLHMVHTLATKIAPSHISLSVEKKEEDDEEEEEEESSAFHSVWSEYSVSAPSLTARTAGAVSPPSTQRVFSFDSFADCMRHMAVIVASSSPEDAVSPIAVPESTSAWPPVLPAAHEAELLIHLLEHAILPNSSMYNPRTTDGVSGESRFRSSPTIALFVLFHLSEFVALHARFFEPPPAAVVRGDGPTATASERTIALEVQWSALLRLGKTLVQGALYSGTESAVALTTGGPLFASAGDALVTDVGTVDFAAFTRICSHRHRFDARANALRRSARVTLAVLIEVIVAAVERRINSMHAGDTRQKQQQACADCLHAILAVMQAHA